MVRTSINSTSKMYFYKETNHKQIICINSWDFDILITTSRVTFKEIIIWLKTGFKGLVSTIYSLCDQLEIHHSSCDHSLFIYTHKRDTTYLHLYVDDIILITLLATLKQCIMTCLSGEFAMKDLVPLNYLF